MNYLKIYISYPLFACIVFFTCGTTEADNIIASHDPGGQNFNTTFAAPAGQYYYSEVLYRVKQAQTFLATQSGFLQSVSFAACRSPATAVPLRIRILDTSFDVPNATLAEAYLDPSDIPVDYYLGYYRGSLNTTVDFTSSSVYMEAGSTYSITFDTIEPVAEYFFSGSDLFQYPDGARFTMLDDGVWTEAGTARDLYFEVRSTPPLAINSFTVHTNNLVQITWTGSVGETWIDQSTNLQDWDDLAGPLTNSSSWAGTVEEANQRFFRIRY